MHMKMSSAKWRPFCPGEIITVVNAAWFKRRLQRTTWQAFHIRDGSITLKVWSYSMMTSSNGRKTFRVTGRLIRGIHWSPVNSPYKGQWRGALMFPLIGAWTNGWLNNRDAGDLRRHRAHYCNEQRIIFLSASFKKKKHALIFQAILGGVTQSI